MTDLLEPASTPTYKDRKVGLVLFGFIEIGLGALSLLMATAILGMTILAALHPAESPANQDFEGWTRNVAPGATLYILSGVAFIWLGFGSILARRWARAVLLVVSWFWLISGTLGVLYMLVMFPTMFAGVSASGDFPSGAITYVQTFMIAFGAIFFVLVPGAFVLFYGSRDVKMTCEVRDPVARWTDRCPLPVLGISVICAVWSVINLPSAAVSMPVPFFGTILTGGSASAFYLAWAVLLGAIAWGTYRLNRAAWWGLAVFVLLWTLSIVTSASGDTMQEYFAAFASSKEQLQTLQQSAQMAGSGMAWGSAIFAVAALVYLLYVHHYFVPSTADEPPQTP